MPYKEPVIEKTYFTIGEVAKMFKVRDSLIRYWANEFEILKLQRNRKGNRLFKKEDIDNVSKIYHLVKEEGLTIEGAKKRLAERYSDEEIYHKTIATLQSIKRRLEEVKNLL